MTDINGKVALVTGSARGLGRAIAERFAASAAERRHERVTDRRMDQPRQIATVANKS